MEQSHLVPIPQPRCLPFVGNILEIDFNNALESFYRMADTYGPIYRFSIAGQPRIMVSSQALTNEVCDESRFGKKVSAALEHVRNGTHDGLFTAYGPEERNWGIAHRILMPAFGPMSIRSMFDEMHDIATQLALKFARHGPNYSIEVAEDFTRLTLDTLALCAMDYRFNSFYTSQMHPFIEAMGSFLFESGKRAGRPELIQSFLWNKNAKYDADISVLRKTGQEVIDTRRQHPTEKRDLLNAMLKGVDPKTGEGLSDDNIISNMITFLIAGHETTSGLLSFMFYYLLKNPASYRSAQEEVDRIVGQQRITTDHLSRLPYVNAVLRETLRLQSTAPLFTVSSENAPQILQGKYCVGAGEPIGILLHKLHRDPKVWGDDAEEWRPERMLDENFNRVTKDFPNCWKPFGNGMRACIGRPFALQEALLVTVMLLQNFNFSLDDPSYQLSIKQTLTIKPKDFRMRAFLRHGLSPTSLEQKLASGSVTGSGPVADATAHPDLEKTNGFENQNGIPLSIFFGSNTGTCEALAHRLANDATSHGFKVVAIDHLDSGREKVPKGHPVVIILASYEGQPADNAAHFVSWLQSLTGVELDGVQYSVFGCGHHDWANTFHRIPKLVDRTLEERGAHRLAPMGITDQASSDSFTDFERWEDDILWKALESKFNVSQTSKMGDLMDVQVSTPRPSLLKQAVNPARVVDAKILSSAPEKRHLEVELPKDTSYSTGDYLVVLPVNPKESIARALRYFGLAPDSALTVSSAGPTNLPTKTPLSATDLFGNYLELSQPASKRTVASLADLVGEDETAKFELTRLAGDAFDSEISESRVSLLDLLERFPSVSLPLPMFIKLQPPMRVRQYSISSSPLWNTSRATITYAVVDEPSIASPSHRHVGVASSYLASLAQGDVLNVSVRPPAPSFRLPADPQSTPIIMAAAGTGVAPFRGFIQERAIQMAAGRKLAPALLFFGCRRPNTDDLYEDEFARWESEGVVRIFRAYSQDSSTSEGSRYVQDCMWRYRDLVADLWENNAKLFVCGSAAVGREIGKTFCQIRVQQQATMGTEITFEEAEAWFQGLRNKRVAVDVFV